MSTYTVFRVSIEKTCETGRRKAKELWLTFFSFVERIRILQSSFADCLSVLVETESEQDIIHNAYVFERNRT